MAELLVEHYGDDGFSHSETVQVPDTPPDPVAVVMAAVQTARVEVSGFSPGSGTRQAVEALATAVETLVQGA